MSFTERCYLSSETLYFSSSWLASSHLPLRIRTFASARIKLQAERVTQFLGLDCNGNFSNPSGHVRSRIADNTNIGSYNRSSLRLKDRKCLSHHARTESPDPEYFHMHYFVKDNISLSLPGTGNESSQRSFDPYVSVHVYPAKTVTNASGSELQ